MTDILEISDLAVHYGGTRALDGASLSIPGGAITGIIGPNGAGKSTLFNAVSGLVRPTRGTVHIDGVATTRMRPPAIARMGVSRTFQTPRAFPSLDLIDNLCVSDVNPGESLWRAFGGGWREAETEGRDRAAALLERVGLAEKAPRRADELSGGELRLLEVARQLMRRPRLLLLDEPTAGANQSLQTSLTRLLGELAGEGVTILVVEHNLRFLLALADRVVVMHQGLVLSEGTPEQVRRDPAVIAAYLGREHHVA